MLSFLEQPFGSKKNMTWQRLLQHKENWMFLLELILHNVHHTGLLSDLADLTLR